MKNLIFSFLFFRKTSPIQHLLNDLKYAIIKIFIEIMILGFLIFCGGIYNDGAENTESSKFW